MAQGTTPPPLAAMSFNSFFPALAPSLGTGISWNARLIENNFGDGYRQTAPDGLNAVVGSATLSWDMLKTAQADYIDNFLRANVGRAFAWQPPNSSLNLLWDCKAWSRTNVYGGIDKMSATFTQRFDLG